MQIPLINKLKGERTEQVITTAKTSYRMMKMVWRIDHKLFILASIFYLIPSILPFINAYIYKLIIDNVVLLIQINSTDLSQIWLLIGARVITYFAQDISFNTRDMIERILFTKFPITINQIFFKKVSSLDIQFFENSDFRNLLEKAREGYGFRPQKLYSNTFYAISELITVIIAFIAIARLNWYLVILISLVVIPEFIIQAQHSKLAWGIWGGNATLRKRFDYLQRVIQGAREVKEVKIFQLSNKFLSEIKKVQQKFYEENKKLLLQNYTSKLVFQFFGVLIYIGFEIYVIVETVAKRLTIGDIGFYTGIVMNFHNSMSGFFRAITDVFDSSLYVKHIFEVLDIEPMIKVAEKPVKIDIKKSPMIEFKNVNFAYPDTKDIILKNFNLTINPGEKVALVGENGAGKSTIIKLLVRFYDVTSGEILVNGHNLKDLDPDEWYKVIGVLFQDFNKYDDTVRENIGLGKVYEEVELKDIMNAASSAGAHPMISKLEKGYEQMLGRMFDEGIELSGGQWQKIALARAFLRDAPILILDEPTASIDAKSEAEIFNKVGKLEKDKTVIIISHRFSTVRNADKIYVIGGGKIIESGSHDDLLKLDGEYASMFKLQAKGYR